MPRIGLLTATLFALATVPASAVQALPPDTPASDAIDTTLSTDSILGAFDDAPVTTPTPSQTAEPQPLQFGGWVKLSGSWNYTHDKPAPGETDWRGLSRLRAEVLLENTLRLRDGWRLFASAKGSYDFAYKLNGRDGYTSQVLDAYESELELRDTYLSGSLSEHVDIKLGRQVMVWGRSDTLRVTDILNPLDLREPGMTDLEDLRLPVGMLRLDTYLGDTYLGAWDIKAMVIPEIRFNKTPVFGHDFYPDPAPAPPEVKPADGLGNAEYALALNGTFPGWDISFYWADVFDDAPYVDPAGPSLRHSRITLLGTAGNYTLGNFLFFVEAAYLSGLKPDVVTAGTISRVDLLAGLRYTGWADTTLSVEALRRRVLPSAVRLQTGFEQTEVNWSLLLTHQLMRERLSLSWNGIFAGEIGTAGNLQRLQMNYEVDDGLKLAGGLVFYNKGRYRSFRGIDNSDRAFLEMKYYF